MFKNRSFLVKLVSDKDAPETADPIEETIDIGKIRNHFIRNAPLYLVGIAGFSCLMMRGRSGVLSVPDSQLVGRGISVTAKDGISVLGKRVEMNNVSYFSSNRQGPPSWVIRCKETGALFTSQNSAAVEMGLPASEISKHLNGVMGNVRGNTFERICMAA